MFAIPYIIFWGICLYALMTPKKHALLYILFGCMPFGTFAMVSPALTGVSLTVTPMVALIIIFRVFNDRGALDTLVDYSAGVNKLLLLFLFWIVALFITLTMPRYFKGVIDVVPMGGNSKYFGYAAPLEFTTQNVTQLFYMTISVLSVYAFGKLLQDEKMRQHALGAVCFGATILIITGFLDYATQFLPAISSVLDTFRNAGYALLVGTVVLDTKRVVGLMAEASVFGSLTVSFLASLYFLRKSIKNDMLRNKVVPILMVLLIALVWLSTSSGAYIGLVIFILLAMLDWFLRARKVKENKLYSRGLAIELYLLIFIIVIILSLILTIPDIFDPIIEMVDTMVFNKTDSDSYHERSAMTVISWNALMDSYGIGVGLGSTRASNSVIVLISSVGVLGGIFYYGFILQTFLRKSFIKNDYDETILNAIKMSFIPPFVIDFLSAGTPDFGVFNAFRFGLAFAISLSYLNALNTYKAKLN